MIPTLSGKGFALLLLAGLIPPNPASALAGNRQSQGAAARSLSGNDWKLGSYSMGEGERHGAFQQGFDDRGFRTVTAPGEVQLQLGLAGMDLYRQSRTLTLVNSKEWWYRKHFTVSLGDRGKLNRLVFEGVDYFATVWLNGKKLGSHEGAYTPFSYVVSDNLNYGGDNVLAVKVTCPWYPDHRGLLAYMKGNWVVGSPGEQIHVDRPPYFLSAFWDGIPNDGNATLPMGLIRDVRLVTSGFSIVRHLFVETKSLNSDGSATLKLSGVVQSFLRHPVATRVELSIVPENFSGQRIRLPGMSLTLHPGDNPFSGEVRVKNPHLWWTWDLGRPNLYKVTADLGAGAGSSAVFGIRTIRRSKDMSYWLNGRPLFLRGAWYPMSDYYGSRPTRETFLRDLELVKGANLNHLVAFTVVEKPDFYDLCDRLGILVILELPFPQSGPVDVLSHSNPRRSAYVEESLGQVRRVLLELRGHASILEWAAFAEVHSKESRDRNHGWGIGAWSFDPYNYAKFADAIGDQVRRLDPGTIYQPSLCDFGEEHFWEGNAGMVFSPGSYLDLFTESAGVISEYGSLSFPNLESLKKELPPGALWPSQTSKLPRWNHLPIDVGAYAYLTSYTYDGLASVLDRVHQYVDRHIRSAEDLVEDSQLYQGFLMKYATEAFRRKKGDPVRGIRFWDFGEAWPGVRWGIVDYYREPKLSYYFIKRAEAPFSLSFAYKDALESQAAGTRLKIPVWLVNDLSRDRPAKVQCRIRDLSGKTFWSGGYSGTVPANGKREMGTIVWTAPANPGIYILSGDATAGSDGTESRNRTFIKVTPALFPRPLKVLVIGQRAESVPIEQMLRALGVQADRIDENSLGNLHRLENAAALEEQYDVVWLAPLENAWRLFQPQEVAGLKAAIQHGVGFIHSGGRASFHGGFGVGAALDLIGLGQVLPVELLHRYDLVLGPPDFQNPSLYSPLKEIQSAPGDSQPEIPGLRRFGIPGYNNTMLKPGAREILSIEGRPLLATGAFGRGRTVAFTGFTPELAAGESSWVVDERLYARPRSRAYFQLFARMLTLASGMKPMESPARILAAREKPLFETLKDLPPAEVDLPSVAVGTISDGTGRFFLRISAGREYARLVRLKLDWARASMHPWILWSDNDFDLSPGETRTVEGEFPDIPSGVSPPAARVVVDGVNLKARSVSLQWGRSKNSARQ